MKRPPPVVTRCQSRSLTPAALAQYEECPHLWQLNNGFYMPKLIRGGQGVVVSPHYRSEPLTVTPTPAPALSVLEGGAISKNAVTTGTVDRVEDLPVLRVTQLLAFEQCHRAWKAKYLDNVQQPDSPSSKIGTLVHEIVEAFMRREFERGSDRHRDIKAKLMEVGVPDKEVCRLDEYLYVMEPMRPYLVALEYEFTLEMKGVGLPIRGHKDMILKPVDDLIVVVDHKTNRAPKSKAWWMANLQPRLYAWAARKLWPDHRIGLRIGYVNLGKSIHWESEPDDDIETEARVRRIWNDLEFNQSRGRWPEMAGDHCKFCPIRNSCSTFSANARNLIDSLGIDL